MSVGSNGQTVMNTNTCLYNIDRYVIEIVFYVLGNVIDVEKVKEKKYKRPISFDNMY